MPGKLTARCVLRHGHPRKGKSSSLSAEPFSCACTRERARGGPVVHGHTTARRKHEYHRPLWVVCHQTSTFCSSSHQVSSSAQHQGCKSKEIAHQQHFSNSIRVYTSAAGLLEMRKQHLRNGVRCCSMNSELWKNQLVWINKQKQTNKQNETHVVYRSGRGCWVGGPNLGVCHGQISGGGGFLAGVQGPAAPTLDSTQKYANLFTRSEGSRVLVEHSLCHTIQMNARNLQDERTNLTGNNLLWTNLFSQTSFCIIKDSWRNSQACGTHKKTRW